MSRCVTHALPMNGNKLSVVWLTINAITAYIIINYPYIVCDYSSRRSTTLPPTKHLSWSNRPQRETHPIAQHTPHSDTFWLHMSLLSHLYSLSHTPSIYIYQSHCLSLTVNCLVVFIKRSRCLRCVCLVVVIDQSSSCSKMRRIAFGQREIECVDCLSVSLVAWRPRLERPNDNTIRRRAMGQEDKKKWFY